MAAPGRFVFLGITSLFVLVNFGCAQTAYHKDSVGEAQASLPVDAARSSASAPAAPGPKAANSYAQDYDDTKPKKLSPIADSEPDRYLIKNATLTLEARDVRAVTAKVISQAKSAKGYVSGLHETVDGLGTRSVTFTVRVPATQFDDFLQGFEAQGKVLDREVTAEDVTEEYVDTQSKVHNLKATEARLLEHLSKTGKLSDTLLVEKELTRVREEIDQHTGRLKFLAHRISYSTFAVTVRETAHAQAINPPETFSAGKVASDSARSLVAFGQSVLTVGIWLLTWSVVWLPPALIVGFIRWRRHGSMI